MTRADGMAWSARLRARLGSWRVAGVFWAIYLVSQGVIGGILDGVGSLRVLRLQTTLSRSRFEAIFAQFRQEHLLETYASHYYLDVVHPLWYGLAIAALLAKALESGSASPRWDGILYLPLVAGLLDLTENAVHIHYLATGSTTDALVVLGGLAAIAKWTLVSVALALAAGLFLRAYKRPHPEPKKASRP